MELTFFYATDSIDAQLGITQRKIKREDILTVVYRNEEYEVWYWRKND